MKRSWSAFAGVVAGALTLGVATLLAGVMTRTGLSTGTPSPVIAVGATFVDHTPLWLKNFAVASFGTRDKQALFVGMALVLTVLCAAIGVLGARRHTAGLVVFALVGAVGALAAATRPNSGSLDILPTMIGTAAGLWALSTLWQEGARGADGNGVDRRRFLFWGAGLAAGAAAVAGFGQSLGQQAAQAAQSRSAIRLPKAAKQVVVPAGAQLDVKGITPYVIDNADFYRIDTALVVPQLDTAGWSLKVHGMVDKEV
ncbi:MAG: oxidoreductase, partial [Dermatophilaceae bacterium]